MALALEYPKLMREEHTSQSQASVYRGEFERGPPKGHQQVRGLHTGGADPLEPNSYTASSQVEQPQVADGLL
jgi:hypothetical protein